MQLARLFEAGQTTLNYITTNRINTKKMRLYISIYLLYISKRFFRSFF